MLEVANLSARANCLSEGEGGFEASIPKNALLLANLSWSMGVFSLMATANLSARSSEVFVLLLFVCKAELWESVTGWSPTAAGVVGEEEDGVGSTALLGGMGAEEGAEADETGNGDNGGGGGGRTIRGRGEGRSAAHGSLGFLGGIR